MLNGRAAERRIGAETARRVRQVARELGYVPNMAARRLRSHRTGTSQAVLAVVTSFEAPVASVSRAASALQNLIERRNDPHTRFSVTIELFHAGKLKDLPGLLTNDRFSGALIANTVDADDRFLAQAEIPFPVVLIGRRVPDYPSVIENPETGGEAARMLLAAGCRRCGVLGPALPTQTCRGRTREFAETLALAGLPVPVTIACDDRSERAGFEAMRAHLGSPGRVDGVFALDDALAIGAYHAVRTAGLRIPEDISFVGRGDGGSGPYLSPPLSCVGCSQDALHERAAQMLLMLFAGGDVPRVPQHLPLVTIVGKSTRG